MLQRELFHKRNVNDVPLSVHDLLSLMALWGVLGINPDSEITSIRTNPSCSDVIISKYTKSSWLNFTGGYVGLTLFA